MAATPRTPTRRLRHPALMLCGASAICALLVGCKVDNRPLLARGEAPAAQPLDAAYAYAPGPLDLPYAEPAQVRPAPNLYDGYALAERAYAYDRAAWRAPPDYGFDYGDVQPWVWRTAGDDLMFAEPIDDGYRFYYYEPGEPYPYFVRDPNYGYAYGQGGVLTAVLTAAGALLANDQLYDRADIAGRYLARGYDLRRAYTAEPRFEVARPTWRAQAPRLVAAREPWIAAADRQPAWRYVRDRMGGRDVRKFEAARARIAAAESPPVDKPRFRGPPPHAVARGLREREVARNAFEHQAPVVAREPMREDRRALQEAVRAEREPMRGAARRPHEPRRAQPQPGPAAAPPHEGPRAVARNETPHGPPADRGGGRHDHAGPAQAAPASPGAPHGGGHGDRGGDNGRGHGHKR
jgi:hypothetical protein